MSSQTNTDLHIDSIQDKPTNRVSRGLLAVGAIVWLTVVVSGLFYVWKYENKAGASAVAPQAWPLSSLIQRSPDQATLIMMAHPHCPCTRASIGELAAIMSHCQGRVKAVVLFLKPEGTSENWENTDLWRSAASIPGVEVLSDRNGNEARRFNSSTSGQTFLYDVKGQLIFSGGITSARGHAGDNEGRSAIVALINDQVPYQTTTAVFGCPLFNPNDECRIPQNEITKP